MAENCLSKDLSGLQNGCVDFARELLYTYDCLVTARQLQLLLPMTRPKLTILQITDPAGNVVPARGVTASRVGRSVRQLLAGSVLCSMASVDEKNHAYINAAYFCYSADLELYFISHPNARHCRNLLRNPSMAMAVFSSGQTWGGSDSGLQLFGTCKQARGREATKADTLYAKRFPEYHAWKADLASDSPGRAYRFYRFTIARLKVFDEEQLGSGVFVLVKVERRSV